MAIFKPFKALRPSAQYAKSVASKPYDVLSSKEAKAEAQGNPLSFLHITKSEIDLSDDVSVYSVEVYKKAKENLDAFKSREILFQENKPCFYIYQLKMNGRYQTGLVGLSAIDDYEKGLIKKHELTRPDKELDRINHIQTTRAQTGNVFLTYKSNRSIDRIVEDWKQAKSPVYDFITEDEIQHTVWIVSDTTLIERISNIFKTEILCTYIADGHHRAASAAKVRKEIGNHGSEAADYFLTTLFPDNQLQIMDYNRVVKDLNGWSEEQFIEKLKEKFSIKKSAKPIKPARSHEFGLYLNKKWYHLQSKEDSFNGNDPIQVLDVSILQQNVLEPLLNIKDQRTDKRIDFVGGIRGLEELENRVNSGEMAIAFSLYPVSMEQLLNVADSENIMPPKSTWFEPKLRDGLFTHVI